MVFFDHVYIDMFRESGCRLVVGWVSSHICCVTSVEFPGFIDGFVETKVCIVQLTVELDFFNQGNPKIMFSFPQVIT